LRGADGVAEGVAAEDAELEIVALELPMLFDTP
jgi:hypothetical protein